MPTGDLIEEYLRGAPNRHLRMFVGAWMVSDADTVSDRQSLLDVMALYEEKSPGLLDRPGRLTDAMVAREVSMLLEGMGMQ